MCYSKFKTDQEAFWAGEFGTEYIGRNHSETLLASNLAFFARALHRIRVPSSCIEFGANIGMNIKALKLLYPHIEASGIEINPAAARQLATVLPPEQIYHESILNFIPSRTYDLTLIKGVLIHINPEVLSEVYQKLVDACGEYLLVVEYFNPTPVSIPYFGHSGKLFKRDFAGEIMDRHQQMRLVDYGFVYHRDPSFPQDDITWFLMKKN